MRHTARWWAERVAELEATGDARAIAKRHGIKAVTLRWWRSELRRREATQARPRLLPVVLETKPPERTEAAPLELLVEVGSARLSLRGAIQPEHLAAIVTAAARAC